MASDHDHSHQHAHGTTDVRAVRHAAAGARARNDPDRKGLCRSGGARPDRRGLSRRRSARISAPASSRAPGSIPSSSGGCSKTRPRRPIRSGSSARSAAHLIALENTPQTHHMVVCTLCSCYPWEVLGLPPVWYKSAPYRSRDGDRPERGAGRVRRRAAARDRDPHLGLDRRDAVPGSADAARRAPRAGARSSSPRLVTRDSMVGTGSAANARRDAAAEAAS